jgi:ectoine hydroxylase-related dioxygenase (phytanoyl-CoA dioxygenase family)
MPHDASRQADDQEGHQTMHAEIDPFSSPYAVTPEHTAAFARDGHLLLRGVFTPGEASAYRWAIHARIAERLAANAPLSERDEYGKMFVQITNLWGEDPAIRRFSLCRRLGQVIADVLGVDAVRLYIDQVLFKDPGGRSTPWHQDGYYIPLDTNNVVTLWMPLVDVTADMGTMSFVSGSHANGALSDPSISDQSEAFYREMIAERGWPVWEGKDMAAGDATLHHGWALHRAPGNESDRTREAAVIVFYPDGTRILPDIDAKQRDLIRYHIGGRLPGELADSCFNPVVFRRS